VVRRACLGLTVVVLVALERHRLTRRVGSVARVSLCQSSTSPDLTQSSEEALSRTRTTTRTRTTLWEHAAPSS
jgi:hypothetical protein